MLAKRVSPSRQIATLSPCPAASRSTYSKPPLPIVRLHQNLFDTAIYGHATLPVAPSPSHPAKSSSKREGTGSQDAARDVRERYALQGFNESDGFARRYPMQLNRGEDGTVLSNPANKNLGAQVRRKADKKEGKMNASSQLGGVGRRSFSSSAVPLQPRLGAESSVDKSKGELSGNPFARRKGGRPPKSPPLYPRTILPTTGSKKLASLTTPQALPTGITRMDQTRTANRREDVPLELGCWVEARTEGSVSGAGLYLGPSLEVNGFHVVLSGSSGEVHVFRLDDVTFVIPPIFPASVAALCAQDPTYSGRDDVYNQVIQFLRNFGSQVDECTRILVSRGARDLYSSAVQERTSITAKDALSALGLPITGNYQLAKWEYQLAMHKLLMDDPLHFLVDPSAHRTTGKFTLRPEAEVVTFETVRRWSREKSIEMTGFAERAAGVREWGTRHQPKWLYVIGKQKKLNTYDVPASLAWTETDLTILHFLRKSLEQERELQPHPYLAVSPSILKLVDLHSLKAFQRSLPDDAPDVDRPAIMKFLAEIGSAPSWENWAAHGAEGALLNWDAQDPYPRLHLKHRNPARTEFTVDQHDSVRKDFGALPVYTIDDPGAMELDDGVSIEEAPSTASGGKSWWIHVHVADPTAILHPGHEISLVARQRNNSEYFPEKTFKMLPDWLVRDHALSLGSEEGRQQKVFSLSTRVDEEGSVLDGQVHAGIVRVVKRLTYEMVDKVLGFELPPPSLVLTEPLLPPDYDAVERSPFTRKIDADVILPESTASNDLNTLYRLSKALLQRRAQNGALYWQMPSASVSVSPSLSHQAKIPKTPIFYTTSPLITLRLPPPSEDPNGGFTPSQTLVSETMILANRTAAKFAVEKEIPVAFRSQGDPVVGASEALELLLQSRDPETGAVSTGDLLRAGIELAAAKDSLVPGKHFSMGIADEYGYTKVTSPLRRYSDLFGHWQIKSALLPDYNPATTLPFSRTSSQDIVQSFGSISKARGRLDRPSNDFWTLYVLEKKWRLLSSNPSKLEPGAAELLSNLTCMAMRAPAFALGIGLWTQRVLILELGIRAQLISYTQAETVEVGEKGTVSIKEIVLGSRSRLIVERKRA